MTWHMQHEEDRVKMMTGCSDMRRLIRVSMDSSMSMDREDEEGELDMMVEAVRLRTVLQHIYIYI